MSISVACPQCAVRCRVPDGSEGKKIKCPKCGERFTVPLAEEEPAAVTAAPPRPKKAAPAEEERPRKRPAKPAEEPDEERDEEVAPKKKKKKVQREEDDEDEERDDEETDDDRPRNKKVKQAKVNVKLVAIGLAVFAFLWCGAALATIGWSIKQAVGKVQEKIAVVQERHQKRQRFFAPTAKFDVAGPAVEVAFGADGSYSHAAKLTAADPQVEGQRCKLYQVTLEKGKTYEFDMTAPQIDTFLMLLGPDGRVVARDDTGGGQSNSRVFFQAPEAGKYKLVATSFEFADAGPPGDFTLSARKDAPPPGDDRPGADGLPYVGVSGAGTAITLTGGSYTTRAALGKSDPQLQGRDVKGKRYKLYTLAMEKGKTYEIDMIGQDSERFDAFLFLLDPANKTVAADDDTGEDGNARIHYQATVTGVHKIVATTLDRGMQGDFTLTVRLLAP